MRTLITRSANTRSVITLSVITLSAGACLLATPAPAAMLRPFTQITASTVRLADLFDELGDTPDRVLGAAPAPGARIVVGSPQLAAIARDFNVAWRPSTGAEQVTIERRGTILPRAVIDAALRRNLEAAGAPDNAEIVSPDVQSVMMPAAGGAVPDVSQVSYDVQSGHFSAVLTVMAPDMPSVQLRMSGQVIAMTQAAVAAHRLVPGAILDDGDVQMARVRVAVLHGGVALRPEAARGLSVRHDVAAGQVLTAADVVRPPLVARGASVRITLNSDGIALSAQGIATQAGARGDRIRVENPVSHLIVDALVTGEGEVSVVPRTATISLVSAQ